MVGDSFGSCATSHASASHSSQTRAASHSQGAPRAGWVTWYRKKAARRTRAVQVELGRREGQLVAESLRWAVTVTFPAANSDMAKYGKAQFGTHKFYTRIAVPPCSNLI